MIRRKNGNVMALTRNGDKNLVVGNCGGDVSPLNRASEVTGRPQPLTMIVKTMISSSSSSSQPPHLREGITIVRYTTVMIPLYILIKYRGKFQWRWRWKKSFYPVIYCYACMALPSPDDRTENIILTMSVGERSGYLRSMNGWHNSARILLEHS